MILGAKFRENMTTSFVLLLVLAASAHAQSPGAAPGYPGYCQVNFLGASGIAPGPAVSVRLTYLGRSSNEVTLGVQ